MPQIQNCVTRYSSLYWCPVPNIRKLACVVTEKYLVSKFAHVHNIQSPVKQEVDMPHIQNWVTRYSSPYWCSVPNIRKLASVVSEKNVTEIFCDADADDDDDDARRQKWSLYVASAKAGRRHNKTSTIDYFWEQCLKTQIRYANAPKVCSRSVLITIWLGCPK